MSLLQRVWEFVDVILISILVGYIFYSGLGSAIIESLGVLVKHPSVEKITREEKESVLPLESRLIPVSRLPRKVSTKTLIKQPTFPTLEESQKIIPQVTPRQPTEEIISEKSLEIEEKIEKVSKQTIDTSSLEKSTFDLINNERTIHGLNTLKWNDNVAIVARLHSQYLSTLNVGFKQSFYLNHADAFGEYQDSRLNKKNIYYFDMSAENLHASSIVKSYIVDGQNTPSEYNTLEELAQKADQGWMNSPGHRQNILTPEYDESGLGIAIDSTEQNYIFTQVFIRRVACGYETGNCCEKEGYLPSCYVPFECNAGRCQK